MQLNGTVYGLEEAVATLPVVFVKKPDCLFGDAPNGTLVIDGLPSLIELEYLRDSFFEMGFVERALLDVAVSPGRLMLPIQEVEDCQGAFADCHVPSVPLGLSPQDGASKLNQNSANGLKYEIGLARVRNAIAGSLCAVSS